MAVVPEQSAATVVACATAAPALRIEGAGGAGSERGELGNIAWSG